MAIAMLAALYLLSELGVEGEENILVQIVRGIGAFCVISATLITMFMLNRIQNEHAQRQPSDLELPQNVRSQRTFTTSDVDEGAITLALV